MEGARLLPDLCAEEMARWGECGAGERTRSARKGADREEEVLDGADTDAASSARSQVVFVIASAAEK